MRRNGFTLLELLIVIAIIALLAALLLPVFQQARKKSYEPVCINNLRQFYVAFSLYREDYGETARFQALLLPYIRDTRVLHCPADTYKRGAGWWGSDKGTKWIETSYIYYRPYTDEYIRVMEQADPNHGIAQCVFSMANDARILPDHLRNLTLSGRFCVCVWTVQYRRAMPKCYAINSAGVTITLLNSVTLGISTPIFAPSRRRSSTPTLVCAERSTGHVNEREAG
jgi:prepilin-type N-terminal cleavage/methylation domain-containing protein